MGWQLAVAYGAVGGGLVEIVVVFGCLVDWQEARRRVRRARRRRRTPALTEYMDPVADSLVAATRIFLGGLAGWVFHSQVTGAAAAVAVGAAAPALLRQLATARTLRAVVAGDTAIERQVRGTEQLQPNGPHGEEDSA